jgi:hypothetical protein
MGRSKSWASLNQGLLILSIEPADFTARLLSNSAAALDKCVAPRGLGAVTPAASSAYGTKTQFMRLGMLRLPEPLLSHCPQAPLSAGAIVRRRLPSDPEAEVRFGVGTNPKPTSKTENTGMG